MKKDSDILTAQQAADLLGVSRSTFQRLMKDEKKGIHPLDPPNPLLKRQPLRFARADIEKLKSSKPAP